MCRKSQNYQDIYRRPSCRLWFRWFTQCWRSSRSTDTSGSWHSRLRCGPGGRCNRFSWCCRFRRSSWLGRPSRFAWGCCRFGRRRLGCCNAKHSMFSLALINSTYCIQVWTTLQKSGELNITIPWVVSHQQTTSKGITSTHLKTYQSKQ